MPCREENVFLLLDGELNPAEASMVRNHLKSCRPCAMLHEELLPLADALRRVPDPELRPYEAVKMSQKVFEAGPLSRIDMAEFSGQGVRRLRATSDRRLHWGTMFTLLLFMGCSVLAAYLLGISTATQIYTGNNPGVHVSAVPRPAYVPPPPPAAPPVAPAAPVAPPAEVGTARAEIPPTSVVADYWSLGPDGSQRHVRDQLMPSGTRIIWEQIPAHQ